MTRPLPHHVLIVDRDESVDGDVAQGLRSCGYHVSVARSLAEGRDAVAHLHPELVLDDFVLPDGSALDLLDDTANTGSGVIVRSSLASETAVVRSFLRGADDFVSKPESIEVLLLRCGAVLRRLHPESAPVLTAGDIEVDTQCRELRVRGRLVETTAKEFDLLAFLAAAPRQVCTREQLLRPVWDSSTEWQDDATVTEHVRRVRRKIEVDPDRPRWLVTVRGVGYRFEP